MPKKKGKKSKKAKKAAEGTDDVTELNIEGEGTQLGIGKKKKKKVKLTKEEKAAAKLAKKLEEFISNEKLYEVFLQKIDHWMIVNSKKVEKLFKTFDPEGEGIVPFDVFRAGLHDLDCPITDLEFNALCKKLDPEATGLIEYCDFDRGIHGRIASDDEPDDEDELIPEDFVPDLYLPTQKLAVLGLGDPYRQSYPRYIDLSVRLAIFNHLTKHPGHFRTIIHSHVTVKILIEIIMTMAKITTGAMSVYRNKSCDATERLPLERTLEECGLIGGPLRKPVKATLYYDYVVEYCDCPLLNADHYFGFRKRPLNPVLKAYPERKKIDPDD